MFTLQSAGASLCTSNLCFMLKDRATLKEVQEQVARLAYSQIHQKGDKSLYSKIYTAEKGKCWLLVWVCFVSNAEESNWKHKGTLAKLPEDGCLAFFAVFQLLIFCRRAGFPRALLLARGLYTTYRWTRGGSKSRMEPRVELSRVFHPCGHFHVK